MAALAILVLRDMSDPADRLRAIQAADDED